MANKLSSQWLSNRIFDKMKSEVSGTPSQQHLENITYDDIDLDSCLRNVSVQTGEEFSPQFLQNLTHRRKLQAVGESSQEYQQEHITPGRTVPTDINRPTKIVQSVKEYHEIPLGNVMGQCQQKRVEFQCNQNEKLVYEYQTGSKVCKNDPVNGTEMSDSWGCRGFKIEAEQTAYADSSRKYHHKDYTIRKYHQNPQQTSTYTNEIYNVQAGFHAYKPTDDYFSEKMKFLCSFGGRMLTRPSDGKLRYVGGDTRIISVNKNLSYEELMKKTYAICNQPHIIKYQLPGEDLDALISVCSDEDFHHMVDEYQELEKGCQRLRVFLESLNELESPCSSEASSIDLTDNAYKYVVAVNGIPEAVLQKSSTRESSGSPKDSTTSLQRDPSSSINPNLTTKLPNSTQIIQATTNMMQSPSFHMPVQYKETINTQLEVGRDRVDHLDVTSYHVTHTHDHIAFGAYNLTCEDQRNVDFKRSLVNESTIQSENFIISRKQSLNVVSDMPRQLEESTSFLQQQDMIKWMEKSNLNIAFDLDTEEFQNIVSPATPLERQHSIATTASSDAVSNISSGLQRNTSLEINRADVNGENPFLLTENDHILTSDFNENDHLINDLSIPNSTISAPISGDVSLGESSIDNLGSQTSDERNADDMPKFLPPDIHFSVTDFLHIQEKTIENECVAQSDVKNVEDAMRMRDGPISDATIAEIQAGIHGLQTIRNDDLEELRELGRGTFGTVYHGKWRGTDVAIKRIKESCFSGKPTEQDRLTKDFWREAQILSQLHHPNVVALYGVVRDGPGGTLSTVTEYMANGSLRHVLSKKNRALDQRKKLIIAQDAAIGMEYLHLKNIVHFDLKCDNLLVNLGDPDRPVCKVGDFGLSRMKRNSLVSGGARGTLPWIAPELLDGSSSRVSEKVDVFSFGIVMWEILTGEEPYADMHCGAIIGGIVTNTLRPPIPRRCDHDWKVLMEECWSNNPADRPSFTDIANKLQAMSVALQSKVQKRVVRHGYNHNHLYKPRVS